MKQILEKFRAICEEPYEWLAAWEDTNKKKVIGCYPMYVPEEIIHAADALPFIVQRSRERISFSHRYFFPFICDFARSSFDLILRGKLDFVDGIVRGNTCYVNHGLSCMIQNVRPKLFQHDIHMVLEWEKSLSKTCQLEELERFKTNFEKFMGQPISDKSLWESIELYNEHRKLVRKIYALRRANPGLLSGREMQDIVKSGMLMPKEEHIQYLTQLIPQLEAKKPAANSRVKFFLSGTLCEDTPPELLSLIEDVGGVITDDEFYMGFRYVAVDCKPAATPIESLAQRYFGMLPCPTRYNPPENDYCEYVTKKARESGAQGVAVMLVSHCEPHYYAYARLKNVLEKEGIPSLLIEMEQESLALARIRTRLEAFIEMLKGRK